MDSKSIKGIETPGDYCAIVGKVLSVGQFLADVPKGIGAFKQLKYGAHLKIDASNESFPLMRHPKSFRATLEQMNNEVYHTFSKAHVNMERIRIEMGQAHNHVHEYLQILKSPSTLKSVLSWRLGRIKEAAESSIRLLKDVCEAFEHLFALTCQVSEVTAVFDDMNGDYDLSVLRGSWGGMAQYFNITKNLVETATSEKLANLSDNADDVAKKKHLISCMTDVILETCLSFYQTHRIADMYVNVSTRFIMPNLTGMLPTFRQCQNCTLASQNITTMVNKDEVLLNQQIKDHTAELQSELRKLIS